MPRIPLILNFVLGAVLLCLCAYAWQLRQKLDGTDQRQRELSAEAAALKSRLAERDQELATAQAALASPAPRAPAGKNTTPPTPSASLTAFRERSEQRAALLQSPEMQRVIQMQRRASVDREFAWLFRKLNLPPAELERLKDLLVERRNAASDVYEAINTVAPLDYIGGEKLDRMVADAVAQVDNTIQRTFGETLFQQYKQYEQTAAQRAVVGQLERRLSYTTAPLTFDQAERLVGLLATAPAATNSAPESDALHEQMIAQSRAILSSPQVDAFREVQAHAELQREIDARMRALASPPAGATSPKP